MLDDLRQAGPEFARGQRIKRPGVDDNRSGLVKCPHQVLALRQIDAHLPAHACIDLCEQRGGNLVEVDPAQVARRRETRPYPRSRRRPAPPQRLSGRCERQAGLVDPSHGPSVLKRSPAGTIVSSALMPAFRRLSSAASPYSRATVGFEMTSTPVGAPTRRDPLAKLAQRARPMVIT